MEKELQEILNDMDVPKFRRNDLKWLVRNLGVRNSNHSKFPRAMEIIIQTLLENNQIKQNEAKKILEGVDNSPAIA